MTLEFKKKVALITGGSRGIGLAIARQLARGGADVAISYGSRIGPAEKAVAEFRALGRKAICMQCDVASQEQIDELVRRTRDELGPIDYLAHCGAISNTATHAELDFERWREMIDCVRDPRGYALWQVPVWTGVRSSIPAFF